MRLRSQDATQKLRIKCGPQGNQLLDLSPELHLLILSYLEPLDVLAIRLTSRGLFSASNERRVWTEKLRRLCYERDIYLPTFDLPSMALIDIEKATCHPTLLERHLLREPTQDKLLVTLSSTVLDDTNPSDRNGIRNLYFIPGGRFLLGFSPKRIQIWDLLDPTQPRRISSMDLTRTGRILNTDVHCPASGDTVYLFAQMFVVPGTKYANQGYETALMVLELDLVNRRRLSRRIVGLRRGLMHINVAAEFLLALDYTRPSGEERFWGWDLSQHHFAKFTLGGRSTNGDGAGNWDLLIQGRQLVLYEFHARDPISCTVTVYPLPTFRKRADLALQRLDPISRMAFSLPANTIHVEFLLWCSFHCRQQLPGGVDTVVTTKRRKPGFEDAPDDLAEAFEEHKSIEFRMLQFSDESVGTPVEETSPLYPPLSSSPGTSVEPTMSPLTQTPPPPPHLSHRGSHIADGPPTLTVRIADEMTDFQDSQPSSSPGLVSQPSFDQNGSMANFAEQNGQPVSPEPSDSQSSSSSSSSSQQSFTLVEQGRAHITDSYHPVRCQVLVPTNRMLQFSHVDTSDKSLRLHTAQFSGDRGVSIGIQGTKSISRRVHYRKRDMSDEAIQLSDDADYHMDTFSGRIASLKVDPDGRKHLQIYDFFPTKNEAGKTWAVPESHHSYGGGGDRSGDENGWDAGAAAAAVAGANGVPAAPAGPANVAGATHGDIDGQLQVGDP
ncbi:hypothetical protein DL96DRAFT_1816233 [Flagelloscypha sp. PMI_526]|nr:hypothetical protein DL96DRAFT_1816233 [Flagelloscypha sp. PMI_526]